MEARVMKKFSLIMIIAILVLLIAPVTLAQSTTRYLSIPSSGFTPRASEGTVGNDAGYDGNQSGTARFFNGSFAMFAPVNLPDDATVNSMRFQIGSPSPCVETNLSRQT